MKRERVPVLIVGGGPIGLATGLALGRFGAPTILVERNPGTTDHPKARGTTARTMEIFRLWGVEKAMRARALGDTADVFGVGRSLFDLRPTHPEPVSDLTPAWKSYVAQDVVEEELFRALARYPTTQVRFSTECIGFEQDQDGVSARLVDRATGAESEVRCDWLVAADGAGSRIRKHAGIGMSGIPALGYWTNEYIKVDLSDIPALKKIGIALLAPPSAAEPWLALLNRDGTDRWLVVRRIGVAGDERDHTPSDAELAAELRRRLGIDRPIEVVNISTWLSAREVAERYRKGRVFLAGDAAHRFLPTGGQGMNTGIADAQNLAWKLAFVISGAMDPVILDSYDAERRPIGEATADFQFRTGSRLAGLQARIDLDDEDNFGFWIDEADKHVRNIGLSLGHWYDQGLVVRDETTAPALDPERYTPVDRPGHRFPHLWVDERHNESTLDWFDTAFVLVTGPDAEGWRAAAAELAREVAVPLQIKTIRAPDRERGIMIGKRGAVLVRPDGYVAWRCAWASKTPLEDLRGVFEKLGVRAPRRARAEAPQAAE
ncbi:MAG TPA: FAD-dependent monooxygenase [Caulobacteraceae bacterium]|nr:FAD-dependent monooxygenase [Caulobacteraceae bacterium]